MTQGSIILLVVLVVSFVVFRSIAKLPSRYERNPKNLSPWNSLDNGIDPTLPPESEI
jgi:hypothetical protein